MADLPLPAFRLRIGAAFISASAPKDALVSFVQQHNESRRLSGVADELNPDLIDPEKAARFVAGLDRLPAATLQRLSGHDLLLDDNALRVQIASPTQAASFDQPFALTIEEVQGHTVLAGSNVPFDPTLARERAQSAQHRTSELDAQARAMENKGPGAALTDIKWRRLVVARAWRMNAQAWADTSPDQAGATASLHDATEAVRLFKMAPRGGTIPG